MGNFLHVDVSTNNLRKAVKAAPDKIVETMHRSLARSAIKGQDYFRLKMPVGVSGFLRQHIAIKWNNRLSVTVDPTAPYADYVEYGTRPHWTSVHNLEAWARLKGINPYALQRSIAKKGTKPHPYLAFVSYYTAKFAANDMEQSLKKAIKEII